MRQPIVVTRFAPSPTGYLHLGHAFSALTAWQRARLEGGRFLLRIEDIDRTRCRTEYVDAILEDLRWLGIDWDGKIHVQSEHFDNYRVALERLRSDDLIYPCFCTRRDIAREIAAAPSAPHGPDGPLYPGTCRGMSVAQRQERFEHGDEHAWRLDSAPAVARVGELRFIEESRGKISGDAMVLGDVVLARKDCPTSYHLAVTVDDHLQGITLVTRGEDLFHVTPVHVLLQQLLGYRTPVYAHHRLLLDENGVRFAKRNQAVTLKALRDSGVSAGEVRQRLGFD